MFFDSKLILTPMEFDNIKTDNIEEGRIIFCKDAGKCFAGAQLTKPAYEQLGYTKEKITPSKDGTLISLSNDLEFNLNIQEFSQSGAIAINDFPLILEPTSVAELSISNSNQDFKGVKINSLKNNTLSATLYLHNLRSYTFPDNYDELEGGTTTITAISKPDDNLQYTITLQCDYVNDDNNIHNSTDAILPDLLTDRYGFMYCYDNNLNCVQWYGGKAINNAYVCHCQLKEVEGKQYYRHRIKFASSEPFNPSATSKDLYDQFFKGKTFYYTANTNNNKVLKIEANLLKQKREENALLVSRLTKENLSNKLTIKYTDGDVYYAAPII